ncbi:MAG: M28 family peptidase [Xanthomonadales bacterium]|nr:M28 family peptidase [Xanthomonadales bacterium]
MRAASTFLIGAWLAGAAAAEPTVIVEVGRAGAAELGRLKQAAGVRWSAEFGNELLLGVAAESLPDWLHRAGVRAGPERLAPEEIVVRDHVCTLHDPEPALAVVGGYEILRKPPSLARATRGPLVPGEPLPADRVVARAVWNLEVPVERGATDPAVQALTARVDTERWFNTVVGLSGFNRNSFSSALGPAHDWILARFAETGLATQSYSFTLDGGNAGCNPPRPQVTLANPIGVQRGATLPEQWVVVGAHYDSRNVIRCDTADPQPGANDNASGCAGVIELARVFANVETARSILFMCFSGEEQGLVGSRRYVESLQASGDIARVRYMINLDMIGYAVDDTLASRVETIPAFASELNRFATAAATYAPELGLILSSSTQAYSDHWYFLAAGIPGAFTWENGAAIYPHYHRATDVPANLLRGRALAGGILKMDTALLAAEAGLLAPLLRNGFED